MPETFWSLLHDAAHWEFELFLMVLFDGVIGALIWPYISKHWVHHLDRDKREAGRTVKRAKYTGPVSRANMQRQVQKVLCTSRYNGIYFLSGR